MSAPQGFNPAASMLPAGGGTIQPMKGGAVAVPVPVTAPVAVSSIDVYKLISFVIANLESQHATLIGGVATVNPGVPPSAPTPELTALLKTLHDLNPAALKTLDPNNITLKKLSTGTDIEITLKVPKPSTGGGFVAKQQEQPIKKVKQLKQSRTLKATQKSQRAALTHKKIHHKQHKNPTADEEEDICLTLIR